MLDISFKLKSKTRKIYLLKQFILASSFTYDGITQCLVYKKVANKV